MVKCYFEGDPNPFPATLCLPPPVGSKLFVEGKPDMWVVTELQYQFKENPTELLLVNVIVRKTA